MKLIEDIQRFAVVFAQLAHVDGERSLMTLAPFRHRPALRRRTPAREDARLHDRVSFQRLAEVVERKHEPAVEDLPGHFVPLAIWKIGAIEHAPDFAADSHRDFYSACRCLASK